MPCSRKLDGSTLLVNSVPWVWYNWIVKTCELNELDYVLWSLVVGLIEELELLYMFINIRTTLIIKW